MPDRLRMIVNRNVSRAVRGKCHLCKNENLDLIGRVSIVETEGGQDHPVCATCQDVAAQLHRWAVRGSQQATFQFELYG